MGATKKTKKTALIDGLIVRYDAASTMSLEIAKQSYSKFEYIGTGVIYEIDGIEQRGEKTWHFFLKLN